MTSCIFLFCSVLLISRAKRKEKKKKEAGEVMTKSRKAMSYLLFWDHSLFILWSQDNKSYFLKVRTYFFPYVKMHYQA